MQSSPTLPPPQPCPHQDVPATGSEALQLFIGTCGTQSVRSDWASHHACQTLLYLSLCYSDERWLAALGALSSLSPAPSSPHSSCPCSSTLSHCPISHQAVWHGQGKACSREKSLHGQQTTPLVSSSNLGMLSDVIGPSQPKDPPALVPGFGKSPAALPPHGTDSPTPVPALILPGARYQQGTGLDSFLASAIRTSPSASHHTPAPATDTKCFLIWGLVCRH